MIRTVYEMACFQRGELLRQLTTLFNVVAATLFSLPLVTPLTTLRRPFYRLLEHRLSGPVALGPGVRALVSGQSSSPLFLPGQCA